MRAMDSSRILIGGRYAVERQLERGPLSIVSLARDTHTGGLVAVKELAPEVASVVGLRRFQREIQISATLRHPNLLPVLDSGEHDGGFFYVTPYLEEGSLRALLLRERQLPLDRALVILRDIGAALSFVHAHGVVHRDLKPENVLLAGGHAVVADFGLARAVAEADDERISSTGITVGTPAYMSPEQASGARDLDSRSDIYTLGCVAYELVAGMPPFVGPTPQAVIAQRFSHDPPALARYRREVPASIERAVSRALAVAPADRFATVDEFCAALGLEETRPSPPPARIAATPRRSLRSLLAWSAAALAAIVVLVAAWRAVRPLLASPLDPARLAVVPPSDRTAGASPASPAARRARSALDAELRRWTGLGLVPQVDMDAAISPSVVAATPEAAIEAAKRVGAGRALWGTVVQQGDSTELRLALYDVARGRTLRESQAQLGPAGDGGRLATAVAELLWDPSYGLIPAGAAGATHSMDAWRAFTRATSAARAWDLPNADSAYSQAVAADPGFALAQLRLAEVRSWRAPRDVNGWISAARRANAARGALDPSDSARAAALVAIAGKRYAEACATYASLRARDSLDARAWYGLADCYARDDKVVRDPRSPSGWRFRSGRNAAIAAWLRAVELEPGFYPVIGIERLRTYVATEPGRIRLGHALDPDTSAFGAYPSVVDDTIAYVPVPLRTLGAIGVPATSAAAITRANELLLEFASRWAERSPNEPEALEALASVLEARGALTDGDEPSRGAAAVLATAARYAAVPLQRLRVGIATARVAVKAGQFARARAVADSLLASSFPLDSASVRLLAGVAALTGRVDRLAALVESDEGSSWATTNDVPRPVAAAASRVFARAVLGACDRELADAGPTVERMLVSYVDEPRRAGMRAITLPQSLSYGVPCTGPAAVRLAGSANTPLLRMQRALADGQPEVVRAVFDTLARMRAGLRPTDVTLDNVYQEAWLRVAIGDTAGAVRQLDPVLEALPATSTKLLTPANAGGLVRAMALRAELAAKRGDRGVASRWARAVVTLWSGADASLQPVVARMRALQ